MLPSSAFLFLGSKKRLEEEINDMNLLTNKIKPMYFKYLAAHISNQKRTSKPCNRLILLSTFLLYYIVIFSDVWYTDNRGDNHAGDNI